MYGFKKTGHFLGLAHKREEAHRPLPLGHDHGRLAYRAKKRKNGVLTSKSQILSQVPSQISSQIISPIFESDWKASDEQLVLRALSIKDASSVNIVLYFLLLYEILLQRVYQRLRKANF